MHSIRFWPSRESCSKSNNPSRPRGTVEENESFLRFRGHLRPRSRGGSLARTLRESDDVEGRPAMKPGDGPKRGVGREIVIVRPSDGRGPGRTRGRHVRSRRRCSVCSAIHTSSRGWPRSSSTREPSDPPLRVVYSFCFSRIVKFAKVKARGKST